MRDVLTLIFACFALVGVSHTWELGERWARRLLAALRQWLRIRKEQAELRAIAKQRLRQ